MLGRAGRPEAVVQARVSALVAEHEPSLMRVAVHWSICRDDAQDALQRALEIYLRRVETLDPATELAWLKVVVKNEALAVRRLRSESVAADDIDLDEQPAERQPAVDDLLAGRERVRRTAEALGRLKPDEAKAVVLKAQGLSYAEIGESLGWTYTKVNRALTEGRARFLKVYADIESGDTCERFSPTLAALVAGTADASALLELRPHISHCASCRATVRQLHATRLGRLAALWPIPALVVPLRWISGRGGDPASSGADVAGLMFGPDGEVILPPELSPLELLEAYEGLDLAVARAADSAGRWLEFKAQVYGWMQRMQGTDVVATAQLAVGTGAGGGRLATLGAVLGLCLSSVGAGTVCVVTGIIANPLAPPSKPAPVVTEKRAPEPEPRVHTLARREPKRAIPAATVAPTPTPTPKREERRPSRPRREPTGTTRPATTPISHETPSPLPVADSTPRDFTFEATAPQTNAQPSAAPATGGGEFAP